MQGSPLAASERDTNDADRCRMDEDIGGAVFQLNFFHASSEGIFPQVGFAFRKGGVQLGWMSFGLLLSVVELLQVISMF